jgi:hypothetical protein
MKSFLRRAALATVVALGFGMAAKAQQAVTVVNVPLQTDVENYSQITTAIVNAIQDASGQNTSNITGLGKLLTNSEDVQDMADVKNEVSAARYRALSAATSGPGDCNALDAGASFSQFRSQVSAWREEEEDQNLEWMDGEPKVNGAVNPASVSPHLADAKVAAAVCTGGFDTAAEAAAGMCGSISTTAGTNAGMDEYADHLFLNDDFSPTQQTAAQLFVSHVVTPSPLPPVNAAEIESPNGAELIASRNAIVARTSLAGLFMSGVLGRRQPWTGAPASALDYVQGEAGQLGGAIPETNGSYFPNGVSQMDYMEVRADSYVYDTQYLAGISSATDDAPLLKALIQVEGFRAWMQYQQYKLDEERGMMEAALLSNSQQPTTGSSP